MIYLDSAATSMLKPESVQYAVIEAINGMASPGRGAHSAAMRAADVCFECREGLAELLGAPAPENVVFTFNATHALNIAIGSLVREGTRVLISGYEHNSVTRPLYARRADVTVIDTPLFRRDAFLNALEDNIRNAEVVICTHVSNAFGYILPVYETAEICSRYGKRLIVDASQSAGVLDVDCGRLRADFTAMPGHKGLLGPQGTGVLICKNEASPLLYGGSGSASLLQTMPDYLPDRLEAGTHNVAGIAGLNEGVKYLLKRGVKSVREHERMLLEELARSLGGTEDLKLFYSPDENAQCGVISVLPRTVTCEALGEALSGAGVAVRTGLHCAPLAHKTVGTLETGTVRFSFSPFIDRRQVRSAAEITEKTIKNM